VSIVLNVMTAGGGREASGNSIQAMTRHNALSIELATFHYTHLARHTHPHFHCSPAHPHPPRVLQSYFKLIILNSSDNTVCCVASVAATAVFKLYSEAPN